MGWLSLTGIKLQLVFILPWMSLGCSGDERIRNFCRSDNDCPVGFRCDTQDGLCRCLVDSVCGADSYCAPDGTCRRRMSCDTNLDCPLGTFCDTVSGNCIESDKCTKNSQCPLGTICSETYFRCVAGCHADGDCPLGDVCKDQSCVAGLCRDKSYCAYGQLCDAQTQTCVDDTRGPFCKNCGPGSISDPYRCGPGPNYCLMTGNDPSLAPFCGVDCNQGQECPNGYYCDLILIAPEGSCRADPECDSGHCYKNEGDTVGFCLCALDDECPQDSCDTSFPEPMCRISRRFCTPGGPECDRPIYCIDGLCLIGRNCAPIEGLRCADLGK